MPDGVGQTIRETVFWTPPELTAPDEHDHINSSLCHGFIFDFCGVEVDRTTVANAHRPLCHHARLRHHPASGMVDGQIRGGFAQALGAALYEEYAYGADGSFLTGTFADYLLPTTAEVPDPFILHMETPSPFTPLGAKGVGEGNCMSTPVCIANAVADALGFEGYRRCRWCRPSSLHARARRRARRRRQAVPAAHRRNRAATGVCAAKAKPASPRRPSAVWAMLLDPATLAGGHPRLPQRCENLGHAFPRRCDASASARSKDAIAPT